jgi:outer membrane protein OmpA-like peptidoglycan-associated protein
VARFGVRHSAPPVAEAPVAAAPDVVLEVAAVKVEDGVVKFFFASNSAEVAEGAQQALAEVIQGLAAGRRAAISGYHDATGSVEQNAELAKQRALAVRELLKAQGASEEAIELRKPELSTGSGSEAEARRVEVILLPAN